jgi:hypothetical protein
MIIGVTTINSECGNVLDRAKVEDVGNLLKNLLDGKCGFIDIFSKNHVTLNVSSECGKQRMFRLSLVKGRVARSLGYFSDKSLRHIVAL